MKKISLSVLLIAIAISSCKKEEAPVAPAETPMKYEVIKIQTNFGNIAIWLYDKTPKHKSNFLKLTKDGFYDSLLIHRVVKEWVIQGGDPLGTGSGGPGYD